MTGLRTNMFLVALGLSLVGVVMIYSATYRFAEPQTHFLFVRLLHLGLGIGVFAVITRVRYTTWRKYAPVLYGISLVSLVLVLIPGIGIEVKGARRWIDLPGFDPQPAEFAKIAAVIFLSCAVARLKPGSGLPFRPLAAVGLLSGLALLQPDFDTAVIIVAGAAGVLWASELRTRDLVLSGVGAVIALSVVMMLAPYRRERFLTFLDPWAVADTSGYQSVQALIAMRAGGFFGSGAGAGDQGAYVPMIDTDMIFALIGEEFGILGMVGVICAFAFLVYAGLRIALNAPSVMARCVAAGLTTMLATQAVFNIGATMVVLPLAGMTLPFVSYGGSSLLVCFAAVGILYRISEDSERATVAKPSRRRTAARPDSGRRDGRARDPRALRG